MFGDPGHAFAGTQRFVIERELGHGGMGVVYQALDLERNTRVALKALTQKDALNIYRLKNEFRQLADLSHPNLVALHELCNEGNSWFFTMELVQGRTFDEYVAGERSSGPPRSRIETIVARHPREASITLSQRAIESEFPIARVACDVRRLRSALRQLVEAVAALHEAGKLHRDIKPSNVLVTDEGRVVVLDFGLVSNGTFVDPEAQDAERTVGGCVFGTPAYMSPEQAAGEAVTPASDWYAVGTMLYEALTGRLPFDGTVLEILRQKEAYEPVAPSELARGVPDDLDQLCRDLLRRDPALRPSGPEILRYLTGESMPRRLFDAQSSPAVARHGELFVGRELHLAQLRDAFEATKRGKPVTVLVHGVSGIGKSALVRCFANELIREDEAVVLRGRCYERETVPYKAFDNIIDALSRYMMRLPAEEAAELLPRNVHSLSLLFPVLRRVKAIAHARRPKNQTADAHELRNQAFAALKDLLLRITDFHPLVINIDDLQWADMDSARLLGFLIGPPAPPPMLLVGTYRRDEARNSPFLQHLLGGRALREGAELRELALEPLSQVEATQLTSALLRDVPEATPLFASALAAEAEGVPFFITELVQHLRSRTAGGALPVTTHALSLEQVVLERVAGMPPGARALLEVLSVAAGPLEQGIAIEAAGLPRGDRAAMLALRAARLIRTRGTREGDCAETYHDRVRAAVVSSLHPEAVRAIHTRIAQAMERFDVADPERLVVHYSGAGDGIRAGETAVEAAHAAARKLAFNRAAELFQRAIELLPEGDAARRALHRHMADALANAGRGAQAAEAYLRAAEGLETGEARALKRMAAQQYLRSGRFDEGTALARSLFRELGIALPQGRAGTLAQALWQRTRLRLRGSTPHETSRAPSPSDLERLETIHATFRELGTIDPLVGTVLHGQFLHGALSYGKPLHVLNGLAFEAFNLAWLGTRSGRTRAERLLRQIEELSAQIDTPYARATYWMTAAGCSLWSGRFADALAAAERAEGTFRDQCTGASWERSFSAAIRYGSLEQTGDLSAITRDAPELARSAAERDDRFTSGLLVLSLPLSHLMRDDPASALALLDEERARLSGAFSTFHLWVMNRTVDTLLYAGQGAQALEYLAGQLPEFSRTFLARTTFFKIGWRYLRARCALATHAGAANPALLSQAEADAKRLLSFDVPHGNALAAIVLASVAEGRGDLEAARCHALDAVRAAQLAQMDRFALYAACRLPSFSNSASDRAAATQAEAELTRQGIGNVERWVDTYFPRSSARG